MRKSVVLAMTVTLILCGCAAGNPQASQPDQSFSILGYDTPLPELPPLAQTTNGEHRVDIVDTSKVATKSYVDESYVIPALPEELPTYKTFAFNGQEYLDYGTFHGYRVTSYRQKDGWGNGEFPHAYVIGPHRYRVLDAFNIIPSGFGVNEGDDPSELNDETFPWNDTHWLPFLYASGLVDDSDLLSIFLQTLAY